MATSITGSSAFEMLGSGAKVFAAAAPRLGWAGCLFGGSAAAAAAAPLGAICVLGGICPCASPADQGEEGGSENCQMRIRAQ